MWFQAWDFTDKPSNLNSRRIPAECFHAYPVFVAFPTGLTMLKNCAMCNTSPSPATIEMFEKGGKSATSRL